MRTDLLRRGIIGYSEDVLAHLRRNVTGLDCYRDIEYPDRFAFAVSPDEKYSFIIRGREEDFNWMVVQPDIIVSYWNPIQYKGYSTKDLEKLDTLKNLEWITL